MVDDTEKKEGTDDGMETSKRCEEMRSRTKAGTDLAQEEGPLSLEKDLVETGLSAHDLMLTSDVSMSVPETYLIL